MFKEYSSLDNFTSKLIFFVGYGQSENPFSNFLINKKNHLNSVMFFENLLFIIENLYGEKRLERERQLFAIIGISVDNLG